MLSASSGMPLRSPLFTPALRPVVIALALVVLMHLYVLGGLSLPSLWPSTGASQAPALQMAVIAPPAAPAPPAQASSPPPEPPRPPKKSTPAPAPAPLPSEAATPAASATDISATPVAEPAAAATAPTPPSTTAPPVAATPPSALPADGNASALSTDATAPVRERPMLFAYPPSIRLNYDVFGTTDGQKNTVGASIVWKHDDTTYQASLRITKFLVNVRQWTSKGSLTEGGVTPLRFGDSGLRRSEVATHFVRSEGKIVFSANTPEFPLLPGTQDNLSLFMQLASIWAGDPNRFPAGSTFTLQTAGPRQVEAWTFTVGPEEVITVPGGSFPAIKLTRESNGAYSTKAELWLAPRLAYLPAHIRLSETNGNVLDMVWTDSENP